MRRFLAAVVILSLIGMVSTSMYAVHKGDYSPHQLVHMLDASPY